MGGLLQLALSGTRVPVHLGLAAGDIDNVDVCDAEVTDTSERITICLPSGRAITVAADDLVAVVDALRRFADQIEEGILDARQGARDAALRECPWCPTLIAPEEPDCGAAACAGWSAADRNGLVP